MKGITPFISKNDGCDYHRIILPLTNLGMDFNYFENKDFQDLLNETKVVIFNRTPNNRLNALLELKKKYDFKIIVDLDDYWVLYPHHHLYKSWNQNRFGEQIVEALKNADSIICTTSLLADKIKPLTSKEIHVIPNALPFGKDQFNSDKEESENIRLMYAGGGSHFWDLRTLKIPFGKINNNPSLKNCNFTLAGFNGSTSESETQWRAIERMFNLNDTLKNYTRRTNLGLESYMDHYKYADVSLIPLEYNNFNRFKSNLKILEAGCKNIPCIVSDVQPYSNESDRSILLYAKNANNWYDHIKYCALNPSFVKEKGLQLGEYVRQNYDLCKVNEHRKQLLESFLN